jgi:hypothetical protein
MDSLVDYSRQEAMDQMMSGIRKEHTHVIIGCGGVGFWVGVMLAMSGVRHFHLIDGQTIDRTNLNRLPVPQTWLGHKKPIALRKLIRFLRPETAISCMCSHIDTESLSLLSETLLRTHVNGVIWDTTDDGRIQRVINKEVKDKLAGRMSYRKIGYEGFEVGTYRNFQVWLNEETYNPGYRTSSANAASSSLAAVLGIFAEGLGIDYDYQVNFKDALGSSEHWGNKSMSEAVSFAYSKLGKKNQEEMKSILRKGAKE